MKKLLAVFGALFLSVFVFAEDADFGIKNVVSTPVNPNATPEAKALMQYLVSNYGKKVISGQMDLAWNDSIDMAKRVYNDTEKYPAIMGFDFLNAYTPSMKGYGADQVDEAIAWAEKGGIVTFCWHWKAKNADRTSDFYANKTTFRIPYDTVTDTWDETPNRFYDYQKMVKDMDKVAAQLAKLQEKGVPVLWRPLHEASGGWFWWGASGSTPAEKAEKYLALYKFMYNYFTNEKGLNNLIWVWNGQSKDWYPGDEYVDIIGTDIYDMAKDYSSKKAKWTTCVNYSDNPQTAPKMVALTETGTIPSPDKIAEDGAWWSYFMLWNDAGPNNFEEHYTHKDNFWTGEYYNTDEHKKEVYLSDVVITLDELKK